MEAPWQRLNPWRSRIAETSAMAEAYPAPPRTRRWLWVANVYFASVLLWSFLDVRLPALNYFEQFIDKARSGWYAGPHESLAERARHQIALVAITENTFRALSPSGPPLPRQYHARVIRALTRAGAKVIAFDMIFAAPRA